MTARPQDLPRGERPEDWHELLVSMALVYGNWLTLERSAHTGTGDLFKAYAQKAAKMIECTVHDFYENFGIEYDANDFELRGVKPPMSYNEARRINDAALVKNGKGEYILEQPAAPVKIGWVWVPGLKDEGENANGEG